MGKQQQPSSEELEFVYGLIVRGLSSPEIKEEIADTEFPLRTDARYFRMRRRELEAARKVLASQPGPELRPELGAHNEYLGLALGKMRRPRLNEFAGILDFSLPNYWIWNADEPVRVPNNVIGEDLNVLSYDELACLEGHLENSREIFISHESLSATLLEYREACADLYGYLFQKASETGLPVLASWSSIQPLMTKHFVDSLYGMAARLVGGEPPSRLDLYGKRNSRSERQDLSELEYDHRLIAIGSPNQIEAAEAKHRHLNMELERLELVKCLQKSFIEYSSLSSELNAAVDSILRQPFPGNCKKCESRHGL